MASATTKSMVVRRENRTIWRQLRVRSRHTSKFKIIFNKFIITSEMIIFLIILILKLVQIKAKRLNSIFQLIMV
jgi:hypothetical protein